MTQSDGLDQQTSLHLLDPDIVVFRQRAMQLPTMGRRILSTSSHGSHSLNSYALNMTLPDPCREF